MVDLLDVSLTPPEVPPAGPVNQHDPWGMPLPPPRPHVSIFLLHFLLLLLRTKLLLPYFEF